MQLEQKIRANRITTVIVSSCPNREIITSKLNRVIFVFNMDANKRVKCQANDSIKAHVLIMVAEVVDKYTATNCLWGFGNQTPFKQAYDFLMIFKTIFFKRKALKVINNKSRSKYSYVFYFAINNYSNVFILA